jgi:single-strand DNA-binding protein
MSYLNSVTLVGFVGADPEQRQARNNGSKFTVFSVATQRSWKTAEDEWVSKTEWHRISIFRPRLAEYVLSAIKKGAHLWRAHHKCDYAEQQVMVSSVILTSSVAVIEQFPFA